jgi:hypothetical protein
LSETIVKVHNIDLGSIAKQIDSKAGFWNTNWEGHIDATLKGIRELKSDIVDALQRLQPEIGRGDNALGQDGPTDVVWTISLLFAIRTIGMLGSKSNDNRRSETYFEDINTIIRQKENCTLARYNIQLINRNETEWWKEDGDKFC